MSLFTTTIKQRVKITKIAIDMYISGLPKNFVLDAVKLGYYYEGIYDLFELWSTEEDPFYQDQIIIALEDEILENKEYLKKIKGLL